MTYDTYGEGTLTDIEATYTKTRYGMVSITRSIVEETLRVAEELFKLLNEVEDYVLG